MKTPNYKKLPHLYDIGDWVKIKARVNFINQYKDSTSQVVDRVMERFDCSLAIEPFKGQIVGGKYKQTGTLNPSNGSHYDDYSPAYLAVEKTYFVWLIRTGMVNKEIYALPEDVELLKELGKTTMKWKT